MSPPAPVVVRIGSDNADVDTQPGLLQYTASTWDTAQAVTVQADAQAETATYTVGLAAQPAGPVTVTAGTVGSPNRVRVGTDATPQTR